jgi:hypothetical protein
MAQRRSHTHVMIAPMESRLLLNWKDAASVSHLAVGPCGPCDGRPQVASSHYQSVELFALNFNYFMHVFWSTKTVHRLSFPYIFFNISRLLRFFLLAIKRLVSEFITTKTFGTFTLVIVVDL